MKLKELEKGDDFIITPARKGSNIMRVNSHLKSGETKVSILSYGTIGYMLSENEIIKVPKERKSLFKYKP